MEKKILQKELLKVIYPKIANTLCQLTHNFEYYSHVGKQINMFACFKYDRTREILFRLEGPCNSFS